jgi:DNA polymerase elongation subunit (family B)
MVKHNISPETVNCPCCPENKVPEIGHHLCTKRRGLVPEVLAPILEKRATYKRLAKTDHPRRKVYKARADVFKWVQVCCFGYLGFKNARFGKIEAHECVNAWGREVLLRAKEAVEARGLHVIHGLVDSLWVRTTPDTDHEALRRAIEEAADAPVGFEGLYKWIRFCPSKTDPLSGIPNRYFGAFTNGEVKVRGLALRRRDTPGLVKELQKKLLARMAQEDSLAALRASAAELEALVEECRQRLKDGDVTAQDLSITFHVSKAAEEYVHDTLPAIAAKKMAAAGVGLHPGEPLQYVILAAKDKVKDWRVVPLPLLDGMLDYDREAYGEKVEKGAGEILALPTHRQRPLI